MKRSFMHFTSGVPIQSKKSVAPKTIDDFSKEIEDAVQKLIDSDTEGSFRLTLPEGLNPEMIEEFMDEVMRRLNNRFGE